MNKTNTTPTGITTKGLSKIQKELESRSLLDLEILFAEMEKYRKTLMDSVSKLANQYEPDIFRFTQANSQLENHMHFMSETQLEEHLIQKRKGEIKWIK